MVSIPELLKRADQKRWINCPGEAQEKVLTGILRKNENTLFGREYLFREVSNAEEFRKYVPLSAYSDLQPYIQSMIAGEKGTLVDEPFHAWMRTDGISGRVKLLPFTDGVASSFQEAFLRVYTACAADGVVCEGKVMSGLEGLYSTTSKVGGKPVGWSSSLQVLALKKIPILGRIVTPSLDVVKTASWKERFTKIAACVSTQNVTAAVADPVLFFVFLRRILTEYKNLHTFDIREVWPDFSLVLSDSCLNPYKNVFCSLLGDVAFREFFCVDGTVVAVQMDENQGYTPLYDQNFLEFISLKEWEAMEREGESYREYEFDVKPADAVTHGEEYVLVLTTPGGLYRYVTGDVVEILDDTHIMWSGWIDQKVNTQAEDHMVLLREVARDQLELDRGNGNQVVAVESETLSYLFGIK
ncbi:MAG: GH3 auxin-responsive promoter family protein [Theionarchaea archaeon]|nr:GH3 auxin-responsive promoter family protein [Theionarchaea archaeon]